MKAIQIIPAKSYKQKRLEFACGERVGVMKSEFGGEPDGYQL